MARCAAQAQLSLGLSIFNELPSMTMNRDFLLSRTCMFGALAAIAAPLCIAAFNPQFPIWLAILAGAAIGCPLLFISFRLDPSADPATASRFWPSPSDARGMLGLIAYAATFSPPVILFLSLLWLIPAGDDWPIVAVRILLVTTAIAVSYWWFVYAQQKLCRLFRGKLSDATIDAFANAERPEEPTSARQAAVRNWELLVVAVSAFLVAAWILNFNIPGDVLDNATARARGCAIGAVVPGKSKYRSIVMLLGWELYVGNVRVSCCLRFSSRKPRGMMVTLDLPTT